MRSGNKPDMRGLAGISQKMDKSSKPDGRAKSSAFQKELPTVEIKEEKPERRADKWKRVKAMEGDPTKNMATEYGGKWGRESITNPDGTTRSRLINEKGQSAKEAALQEGKDAAKKKKDYIEKNTTKKTGAPAIWPFKKKVKTSGAELVKVKKKKSRGKNIKTSNNKLRNAFNKTTKKISDKIKEPGKKGNIPGFNS